MRNGVKNTGNLYSLLIIVYAVSQYQIIRTLLASYIIDLYLYIMLTITIKEIMSKIKEIIIKLVFTNGSNINVNHDIYSSVILLFSSKCDLLVLNFIVPY